jgi:osmotically-inducible protein OsmY
VSSPDPLPDAYLLQHVQDALASDDRARELGVDVTVAGRRLVLTGVVATADQREAIGDVVREVAPDHEVVNELAVMSTEEPGPTEELA